MIQILTASGILFNVLWVGVSSIDGALRFALINPDVKQAIEVFTNPENCRTITRVIDGETDIIFEGYINFRGINVSYDGNATVALSKI